MEASTLPRFCPLLSSECPRVLTCPIRRRCGRWAHPCQGLLASSRPEGPFRVRLHFRQVAGQAQGGVTGYGQLGEVNPKARVIRGRG